MPSEGYEIFEAWLMKLKDQIDNGEEVTIPLKDVDTLEKVTVRGKIGKESSPGAVRLRVVNDLGEKRGNLFIQVIEEMEQLTSAAVES